MTTTYKNNLINRGASFCGGERILPRSDSGTWELRTESSLAPFLSLPSNPLASAKVTKQKSPVGLFCHFCGGERIRTPGPRKRTTVFKTIAFDRSATPPFKLLGKTSNKKLRLHPLWNLLILPNTCSHPAHFDTLPLYDFNRLLLICKPLLN